MPHPEIIAHRGASRERPENSLAAFRRAVELGADAIELDVHQTSDGGIVVHHDPVLADGSPIAILPLAAVTAQTALGEPIPTLDAVFEATPPTVRIYCELKGVDTAAGTLACIARQGAQARAAVHAFDHREVARAARLAPAVARGVLEASYPVEAVAAARAVSARDLWRARPFVDADLVRAARADGRRVIAWTVNDAASLQTLAAMGVNGLCTDDVALARRIFPLHPPSP
ncbi:MAG: hypothetical protein RL139_4 [Gemmatimonadota bacterium]